MKQVLYIVLFAFLLLPIVMRAQACDLVKAIKANEPAQVQACIDAHADLTARDANDRTPLLIAVASEGTVPERQKKIVTALLLAGADPSAADVKGYTALHYAAYQGTYDMVGLLIDKGADITAVNEKGETPLLLAARGPLMDDGRRMTLERLLAAKVNVRQVDQEGHTALHLLCAHKPRLESPQAADEMILLLAQQLEAAGAAVKVEDTAGNTPLSNAMREGHAQTAMWLLDKGASAIPKVMAGFSALHIATERGQWPLIERLLAAGIDINRTTAEKRQAEGAAYFYPKGSTPVDIARIAEHETKDATRKKEWKSLANALQQRGGVSKTYEEYVKGFSVLKGPGTGGSSKTNLHR